MENLPKGHSYLCGLATEPLLYETIGACVDRIAAEHGDREALVVRHQDVRWTFAEYRDRIDELAAGLLAVGIEPGDRVGIWAPNRVEWCLTQFATAKIGAIMVCINPAYRLYELEYALNKVGCRAIISAERFKTSAYLDMLNTLAPDRQHGEDLFAERSIARRLAGLKQSSTKPWVAVVDGGALYDPMASFLEQNEVPTFRTADHALRVFEMFCQSKLASTGPLTSLAGKPGH